MSDKNEFQAILTETSESYMLKEAEKISEEIASLLAEIRLREKYVLGILIAVPVWIYNELINSDNNSCLPLKDHLIYAVTICQIGIIILIGLSVWFIYQRINYMGSYLKIIENYFYSEKMPTSSNLEFGWEKYYSKININRNYFKYSWFQWILFIFFPMLVLVYYLIKY